MRQKIRRAFAFLLCVSLFLVCSFSLFGCELPKTKYSDTRYQYFDTPITIVGYEDNAKHFEKAKQLFWDTIQTYHKLLDAYTTYDGVANIAYLNQMAGKGEVSVSSEMVEFLLFAKEMHAKTNGMVNIAMGSVIDLWHTQQEQYDNGGTVALPLANALHEASLHTDIEHLAINQSNNTVAIADEKLMLNAGALAKGYVAEIAAAKLHAAGYTHYALDLGGNLRLIGNKDGKNLWHVGVSSPAYDGSHVTSLRLEDTSLVTSGSYQRFFTFEGKKYHHIIDPRTLFPAESDFVSVSICTQNAALADALSTYLFMLTKEEGLAFVASLPDAEAFWIESDGQTFSSPGWTSQ